MDWAGVLVKVAPGFLKDALTWIIQKIRPCLVVELPMPINPLGRIGTSAGYTPSWNVNVRFLNRCKEPFSILELTASEEGAGDWVVREVFHKISGSKVAFPIQDNQAFECWVRMESPRTLDRLPIEVGRISVRVRDHRQPAGKFSILPLTIDKTIIQN